MMAVNLGKNIGDFNPKQVRDTIENTIPVGGPGEKGSWKAIPVYVRGKWRDLAKTYEEIVDYHPKIKGSTVEQLGTLGTGNHFIEMCYDENQNAWVMLHSGSRGLGNRIGRYFIEKALDFCERAFIKLPNKDLAYLPQDHHFFDDYMMALKFAQDFARYNRHTMMALILESLDLGDNFEPAEVVECHHNFVAIENHFGENVYVTRKGAVRALKNDLGIIPGSMGAKSYIVRGKENPQSFYSCSHGAGRIMSRNKAKQAFSIEDLRKQTEGVECKISAEFVDEIPGAYKDIDEVMEHQKDLVEIVHTLKQTVCVKG